MSCRRIYPRLKIESPVLYMLFKPDGGVTCWGAGTVVDVSRGGAMIESREPMEGGSVKLSIAVAGENDCVMLGRVIHCRAAAEGRFHCGIKFLGDDRSRRSAVAALVKNHCRRNHCTGLEQEALNQNEPARNPIETR